MKRVAAVRRIAIRTRLQLREFAKEWERIGPVTAGAAVIYNRLAQDMPLGSDATLRDGLGFPGGGC